MFELLFAEQERIGTFRWTTSQVTRRVPSTH